MFCLPLPVVTEEFIEALLCASIEVHSLFIYCNFLNDLPNGGRVPPGGAKISIEYHFLFLLHMCGMKLI